MDLFEAWPKTARGFGPVLYSEKLNGSNVAFIFERRYGTEAFADMNNVMIQDMDTNEVFIIRVHVQTRTQMVFVGDDQVGIAQWAQDRKYDLVHDLYNFKRGADIERHYGEYVKGHGLAFPHVFLFNAYRWREAQFTTKGLSVVPVLYEGEHSYEQLTATLRDLEENGSKVLDSPAEGVIVFHKNDKTSKKYFCKEQGRK